MFRQASYNLGSFKDIKNLISFKASYGSWKVQEILQKILGFRELEETCKTLKKFNLQYRGIRKFQKSSSFKKYGFTNPSEGLRNLVQASIQKSKPVLERLTNLSKAFRNLHKSFLSFIKLLNVTKISLISLFNNKSVLYSWNLENV